MKLSILMTNARTLFITSMGEENIIEKYYNKVHRNHYDRNTSMPLPML